MENPIEWELDKAEKLLEKLDIETAFKVVCYTLKDEHKKKKESLATCHKQNIELLKANKELQKAQVELQKAKDKCNVWREYARSTITQAASVQDTATVIRNYVKKQKRKKVAQRTAAKNMLLDMINSCGIQLPNDLKQEIASLDDLQPRTSNDKSKIIVNGDYIDAHDNNTVNF